MSFLLNSPIPQMFSVLHNFTARIPCWGSLFKTLGPFGIHHNRGPGPLTKLQMIITECPWIVFHISANGRYSGVGQNVSCPTFNPFSPYALKSTKTFVLMNFYSSVAKENETWWVDSLHYVFFLKIYSFFPRLAYF